MNLEGFVPFPADRAARYRSAGYWTGRTVGSILTEAARCWPDRPAVLDGRGRRLSFAELDARPIVRPQGCGRSALRPVIGCCCSCRTPPSSPWRYSGCCGPARSR
ncbi:triostin synthetase I domain protein [Mycobacterium xenopi 3993]|nr:triostin synthetase I domain protein [Mycobacterium xenopi 3993]